MSELKKLIANIPDFPKPGILYRDISPILNHPGSMNLVLEAMI